MTDDKIAELLKESVIIFQRMLPNSYEYQWTPVIAVILKAKIDQEVNHENINGL